MEAWSKSILGLVRLDEINKPLMLHMKILEPTGFKIGDCFCPEIDSESGYSEEVFGVDPEDLCSEGFVPHSNSLAEKPEGFGSWVENYICYYH